MLFTLHRYIFREVFRVFLLAVIALTLIMSLGSILRPVQEYGVGPRQVLHLMGYFLPITLTFVLPIAALFAAALVYGRFAADNELDACKASGISLTTLFYPGLVLAIMVAIANLVLSFHVMPAFVHRAEKSLKADAKQILFRNIQRRSYYELPGDQQYRIYADQADLENNILSGVVVTELKANTIKRIITAAKASVKFNPHDIFNEVQITAYDTYQMTDDGQEGFSAQRLSLTTEFGSLLGDNIKFKKIDEMKKIQADPMRFYPVAKLAREAYVQFTAELLAEDINTKINARPQGTNNYPAQPVDTSKFYKLYSDQETVMFTAGQCLAADSRKIRLLDEVIVVESDIVTDRPLRTLRSAEALLHITGDELAPTLTMEILNATWQTGSSTGGLTGRHVIRGLVLPDTVADKFTSQNAMEAVSPASVATGLNAPPSANLKALQNRLQTQIAKTFHQIKAEIHSRLVFGIGCIPMILIGIAAGIILKGGHLLSAFGASSVPAGLLIVCIMTGKNVTKNPGSQGVSGTMIMWAALVVLCVLAVVMYRRLLKN